MLKHSNLENARVMLVNSIGFQVIDVLARYMNKLRERAGFDKLHVAMGFDIKVIIVAMSIDIYVDDIQSTKNYFIKRLRMVCQIINYFLLFVC